MSISLHCENCKKKIKAPEGAGGKYGNCPYCKHRCYIPRPKQADEEDIKLAPIDESEETRIAEAMRETYELTTSILSEKEDAEPNGGGDKLGAGTSERELTRNIVIYLAQTAAGDLDAAGVTLKKITPYPQQAKGILQRMKKSSSPEPELSQIPPKLLEGLMDDLEKQLK